VFTPTATVLMAAAFWFGAPLVAAVLGARRPGGSRVWLAAAGLAVAVSWFVPSPLFAEHTETFSQHFVGGGVASACVAEYLSRELLAKTPPLRAIVALATVSILGVANEIVELGLDLVTGSRLTGDAAWDLLANTAGAAVAFVVIGAVRLAVREVDATR
jgi:hypothetical protein